MAVPAACFTAGALTPAAVHTPVFALMQASSAGEQQAGLSAAALAAAAQQLATLEAAATALDGWMQRQDAATDGQQWALLQRHGAGLLLAAAQGLTHPQVRGGALAVSLESA